MKCHKPNTDQAANISVFADGRRCTEYALPHDSNSDPNVVQCLIPVDDNSKVRITGNFQGSFMTGCFDLLADGSYLKDKYMAYSKDKNVTFKKRSFDFVNVYNIKAGNPTISPENKVAEGQLFAKPLQQLANLPVSNTSNKFGLGTLVVVISVTSNNDDFHEPRYESSTCGSWRRHSSHDQGNNGGIPPTHELAFKVTDNTPFRKSGKKCIRRPNQVRFGSKPWATFVFHYRSSRVIHEALCRPIPDISFALEAAETEHFISVTQQKLKGSDRNDKSDRRPETHRHLLDRPNTSRGQREPTVDSSESGIFVTPSPVDRPPVFPPPPPVKTTEPLVKLPLERTQKAPVPLLKEKKKKLFGQNFTLPPMKLTSFQDQGHTFGSPIYPDLNTIMSTEHPDPNGAAGWPSFDGDPFANFDYPILPPPANKAGTATLGQVVQTYDDGDDYEDELFLAEHLSPEPDGRAKQKVPQLDTSTKEMDNAFYQSLDAMSNIQFPFTPQQTQEITDFQQRGPIFPGFQQTLFHSNNQPPYVPVQPSEPPMQSQGGNNNLNGSLRLPRIETPASITKRARSPSNKSNSGTPSSKKPRKEMTDLEAVKADLRRQVEEKKRRKAELIEQESRRQEEKRRREEEQKRAEEARLKAEIEQLRKELAEADEEVEQMERAQAEWSQSEGSGGEHGES